VSAPVRKLVIPAAGFGTRFLPFTKAMPKEMLPVVDTPLIQIVVEDAVKAGIKQVIIITGSNKRAIEDHFDYNFALEHLLKSKGKTEAYEEIRRISDLATFIYVRQKEPLGNGHAILQAKEVVGKEPFAMLWGDDLARLHSGESVLKRLIETHAVHNACVMNLRRPPDGEEEHYAQSYGNVRANKVSEQVYKIQDFVEKPGVNKALSHLYQMAGFVLEPIVFDYLEKQKPGHGGEIILGETIGQMIKDGVPVFGYEFDGELFDGGNKLNYLKMVFTFALRHPELGGELKKFLKEELEV